MATAMPTSTFATRSTRASSTARATRCRRAASSGARAGESGADNPLASAVVRNVEEARAAVREQIEHGADWIKLFPARRLFVHADGTPQYVADLSDAGPAGSHRRDAQART